MKNVETVCPVCGQHYILRAYPDDEEFSRCWCGCLGYWEDDHWHWERDSD